MNDQKVLGYKNLHTAQVVLCISNDRQTYDKAIRLRDLPAIIRVNATEAEYGFKHWAPKHPEIEEWDNNEWPDDIDWSEVAEHINQLGVD